MIDKNIDINKELMEFFEERERKIEKEKGQAAREIAAKDKAASRHIPAKIKQIIIKEYGEKCANPNCTKQSENLHHVQGFAIVRNHDPRHLQPLCKAHHDIAHHKDSKYLKYKWSTG